MRRKGQAAMEFLMTYGWAIIVVLAAIGALAYFGVLSPGNLLPERTTFQSPLPNIDNAVVAANGGLQIAMRNNLGATAEILNASSTGSGGDCGAVVAGSELMSIDGGAFNATPQNVSNGAQFTLTFNCSSPLTANDRFSQDFAIFYKNTDSGLTRPHAGSIKGKVI